MKAWIFRRYGGPEALEWAELPEPLPRKDEIVVRVVAAALNPLDWKLRAGQYRFMTAGRLPRGVGYDYAGVVESVGKGVTRLKAGDAVVGMLNPLTSPNGAMAERVCATQALATLKPPSLTFAEGASLPGAGITAVQALRDARLAPDRTIDYQREDWKALGERFDIVFDASGTSTFPECRRRRQTVGPPSSAQPTRCDDGHRYRSAHSTGSGR